MQKGTFTEMKGMCHKKSNMIPFFLLRYSDLCLNGGLACVFFFDYCHLSILVLNYKLTKAQRMYDKAQKNYFPRLDITKTLEIYIVFASELL
jgi:hypothetical protein